MAECAAISPAERYDPRMQEYTRAATEDTVHSTPHNRLDNYIPHYSQQYRVNEHTPLWLRKNEDVTHEDYASFYKSLSNDREDHLAIK